MLRYLRLIGIQLRTSALLILQYRLDFFVDAVMSLFWTATALVPLLVLFQDRATVAGWTWGEALLVVGFFTLLKGVLDGGIQPALIDIVERIRKGTLDFLLLKPADAQFLASTAKFEPWKGADILGGLLVIAYGVHEVGRAPRVIEVLEAGVVLGAGVLILYSLLIAVVSLAFYVVKVDNLSFLFLSIYDAARWPSSVFRGPVQFLFTFVIPLAVMTTFPALAVLGRITPLQLGGAVLGSALVATASRLVWSSAIRRYTSAGG